MRSSSRNSTSDEIGRHPILKSLLGLATTVLVAYAILVAVVYLSQRALLYPGASWSAPREAGPAAWGENVQIDTPDGERLHALHMPAAPDMATFLFFHGNADDISRYSFLAQEFGAQGFGLLALSYRGFGASTGSPSETGLLADGLAAYDWLAQTGAERIIPLGQSLGGGVAVHVAAERETAGLVLLSTYSSILSVARSYYFFLPVDLLLKDRFRADQWIAHVTVPKLFVHGRRDNVIPLAEGEALHALAPEPKEFVISDDLGHNDLWSPQIVNAIVEFAQRIAAE